MISLDDVQVILATRPLAMHAHSALQISAQLADGSIRAALQARRGVPSATRENSRVRMMADRTAVVEIFGMLFQRPTTLELFGLAISCQTIRGQIQAALVDPAVDRICLVFDTPGGDVSGVQELATDIRAWRNTKPIVGIADSMAASAGYWLLAQCSEVCCTPGGQVGSIGVVTQHVDESRALDMAGIKTTLISAGRYKTEGNGLEPLSAEARKHTQRLVDSFGRDFVQDVAAGRGVSVGTVEANFGQGRLVRPTQAKQVGMIDGIGTLTDVLSNRVLTSAARTKAYQSMPPALARAIRRLDLLDLE